MRTTVDLPDDVLAVARQLAHDSGRSMSQVITDLIRLGMRGHAVEPAPSRRGVPVISIGRAVTADDVRSLDDDT